MEDGILFLIGMPGAGKSSTGRALARMTNREFVDLDSRIEQDAGKTISAIFALEGEGGFRARETRLLGEAVRSCARAVVGTGGGIVTREENVPLMKKHGTVIYLQASEAMLWERVRHETGRPLLDGPDPRGGLAALLEKRRPLYEAAADITVETDGLTPEQAAEAVRKGIEGGLK